MHDTIFKTVLIVAIDMHHRAIIIFNRIGIEPLSMPLKRKIQNIKIITI